MAGGMGTGRPFEFNTKCLVFSGAMVTAYWTLPCRNDPNKWLATALISTASYVGLAWYDHLYDCNGKMKAGALAPFMKYIKPPIKYGRYT